LKRYSSKDDVKIAKKHIKRGLTSLSNRELQTKITVRYLTPIKITIMEKTRQARHSGSYP
jgi:hypothetical protein